MEGTAALSISVPPKPKPNFHFRSSNSSSFRQTQLLHFPPRPSRLPTLAFTSPPRVLAETIEQPELEAPTIRKAHGNDNISRRVDHTGRFCSPRSARELALLISYAACLDGSDPVRLFDKRVNVKRESGYMFDKTCLLDYDHMSFGGAPVETGTEEEAEELVLKNEKASSNEADVLSAPIKLVYSKSVLRLTREILGAVVRKWDENVGIIDKIIPQNWKNEPAGRILELCILHLAMAEIKTIGTRHQIVINEAVDLAKRFCDGSAPRIVNGCLRTFIKDRISSSSSSDQNL
ncbi:N utilization substance protein B-like protein [Zostera marina]|uniref:N utilization substance protein B-like protein n=1 Tax=Zostera marina TaxID=29655 RepID=A0A0K9PTZ2_ZOSMR|nr:N utilization substance protein B-like protein [Zostera marina]